MEIRRNYLKEALLFTAIVIVEFTNVGLTTLFKAATLEAGLSYHVFLLYTYAVATPALLPLASIFRSSGSISQVPSSQGSVSLALLGFCLSCLVTRAQHTVLQLLLQQIEKLVLRSRSTQVKIIGTIVSISGAFVVAFYKGPTIITTTTSPSTHSESPQGTLASPSSQANWIIGGLLLAAEYLLLSTWYIIQTEVMKIHPVCFKSEKNLRAWRLNPDIALVSMIYQAGLTGSFFNHVVHSWGLHLKGPMHLAIFQPLSVAIAAIMGVLFLGDDLHLGSVIGALIICIGLYAFIWGKAPEERLDEEVAGSTSIGVSSDINSPFLQSPKVEDK